MVINPTTNNTTAAPEGGLAELDLVTGEDRFATWIAPEADFVRRVSTQFTRTAADADDLAQEALTKAYRGIDTFDGRYPRAWLRRIVANTAANNAKAAAAVPSTIVPYMTTLPVPSMPVATPRPPQPRWPAPRGRRSICLRCRPSFSYFTT